MLKFGLAVVCGALLLNSAAIAETLIKDAEARLPPPPTAVATRAITRGPGVRVISPDTASPTLTSPFKLNIAFEPRGGAKIDLSTVKVTYLKSPSVDLLDRVRNGLTEKGISLASAEVPPGEHQIRVSVQDSEGRQTSTLLNLNIVP